MEGRKKDYNEKVIKSKWTTVVVVKLLVTIWVQNRSNDLKLCKSVNKTQGPEKQRKIKTKNQNSKIKESLEKKKETGKGS